MPLFSGGKTQFMILHGAYGIWSEEFISLEYDVDKVMSELHESKLEEHAPYWSLITKYILRGGNNTHADVLKRAMELCSKDRGECLWPDIPESYWAMAVEEIIAVNEIAVPSSVV